MKPFLYLTKGSLNRLHSMTKMHEWLRWGMLKGGVTCSKVRWGLKTVADSCSAGLHLSVCVCYLKMQESMHRRREMNLDISYVCTPHRELGLRPSSCSYNSNWNSIKKKTHDIFWILLPCCGFRSSNTSLNLLMIVFCYCFKQRASSWTDTQEPSN